MDLSKVDASFEDKVYAKVTRRVVSFLFICFIFAFLDRVNVAFSKMGMQADLKFDEAVFGFGAGVFFLSYFLLEVPSNMALTRFGARRWFARIMVTWGLLSICMLFVKTPTQFYILRFLLGAAEAGFFPGVMWYLTRWYPAQRRSRVITMFMAAIPVSSIIGSPLSGWILSHFSSSDHMAAWQWLFLIEGLPPVILGIITLRYLSDSVADAKWLTNEEKQLLQARVEEDQSHGFSHRFTDALRSPIVWLLTFINFSILAAVTLIFWLPSLLRQAGMTDPMQLGWVLAMPYVVGLVAMLTLGRTSDRLQERRWHTVIPALCYAAGTATMPFVLNDPNLLCIAAVVALGGNIAANSLSWNLPTAVLSGATAAVGIAFINAFGQIAGLTSPALFGWLFKTTGSPATGLWILATLGTLGALAPLLVPKRLVNR
jgi:D-galactonate transporter